MKSFDNINIAALEAVSVRKLPDIVENDADGVKNAIYEPVAKMAEQVNSAFGAISNNFVEHETKVNAAQIAVVTAQAAADTAKNAADSKSSIKINNVKGDVNFVSDPQAQITASKNICENLYNNNIYRGSNFYLNANGLYLVRPSSGATYISLTSAGHNTVSQSGIEAGWLISGSPYVMMVTDLKSLITYYWWGGVTNGVTIKSDGNFVVFRLSHGAGL